jgi:hypothetical protein
MFARLARSGSRALLGFAVAALVLVPGAARAGAKKTHLGVPVKQIVNLRTENIPNDNAGGALFRYDREGDPFAVPPGFSFVVTDIFVDPVSPPNTTDAYLVVVNLGGRLFDAKFIGAETRHFPLAGGMVIPAAAIPDARNTTFSSGACEVQLLGYFVKGEGLAGGQALFPAPQP